MRDTVRDFVRGLQLKGRVLDVGSFDVNGNVRDLFEDYTGLDVRPGKNVDVVADAASMPYPNDHFEVVLCLGTLEHDEHPFDSIKEMKRVLCNRGKLVVVVPGIGFPKHEYPKDYWRFTEDGVRVLLSGMARITAYPDPTGEEIWMTGNKFTRSRVKITS
ncbi:MAG: methyltransferase domain-containing protein [Planctomycetota bacterium]|jgi:SAM-dependent methyltransferase